MAYIDTENIPLHMPVPGTREPAQIALLNENCVVLSQHDHTDGKALAIGRLRSGLEASRPAAGSAGNVYFSTDTGRFYADTGTAWVGFLTEGGQGTVTGWTLIDPVIRDTLQFGPEGSATIDNFLQRTGANALRTDSNLGIGVTPEAWGPNERVVRFGQGGSVGGVSNGGSVHTRINSYFDGTLNKAIVGTEGGASFGVSSGMVVMAFAPQVAAGATQAFATRFSMNPMGHLGLNVSPRPWSDNYTTIDMGARGFIQAANGDTTMVIGDNTYYDGTNGRAIQTGPASQLVFANGAATFYTAASVAAGAVQTWGQRMIVAGPSNTVLLYTPEGTTWLNMGGVMDFYAEPGNGHMQWRRNNGSSIVARWIYSVPGLHMVEPIKPYGDNVVTCGQDGSRWSVVYTHQLSSGTGGNSMVIGSSGSIQMSFAGYAHPLTDASMYLGHPSWRWASIYLAGAPVVGSSLDLKEDIAPLDGAACAEAVLGTDWVSYAYKAPAYTPLPPDPSVAYDEHDDNDTKAEKKAKRDEEEERTRGKHAEMLEETAASRQQKGYVLDSPDHRVHALFGLPDRKNRSDGSDIAVVACALKNALERIAALEAVSGQAPAA